MVVKALIVGGTNGIGYAMACRIAGETPSSTVVISGRTKPETIPHSNIEFRQLDASSMKNIKQYADDFKANLEKGSKLDLLILTQGLLSVAGRIETPEGIDRKMALHYYGRQLLIRELLPVLADDAKVIMVLKAKHGNPSKLLWDDLDLKTHFSILKSTDHCMTMTDAMVQYYAMQQQQQQQSPTAKRHFVHAWPGPVDTNILSNAPWVLRKVLPVLRAGIVISPDSCARSLLDGTNESSASGEMEGRFWGNLDSKGHLVPKKHVWDEKDMNAVAEHTWHLVDEAIAKDVGGK